MFLLWTSKYLRASTTLPIKPNQNKEKRKKKHQMNSSRYRDSGAELE